MNPRRRLAAAIVIPMLPALLAAEPAPRALPQAVAPGGLAAAVDPAAKTGPTDFVRFVEDDEGARLQTGVASYRNKSGVVVDLVGAIHVADEAYFKALNERFKGYEVVLYEMVGGPISKRERRAVAVERAKENAASKPQVASSKAAPLSGTAGSVAQSKPVQESSVAKEAAPATAKGSAPAETTVLDKKDPHKQAEDEFEAGETAASDRLSWLQGLHSTIQNTLELKGQLDIVDYHAPNFVHADMSLAQFASLQDQRKEGFIALWLKAVQVQMEQPQTAANQPGLLKILEILCRKDSATELKRLFGRTFDSVETVMTGMESGDGTVIVSERNKVALRVMQQQIQKGRKHLAVFYGAAHLPDMEKRLLSMGFTLQKDEWLTAWDLPPPPPEGAAAAAPVPAVPPAGDSKPPDGRQNP